MSTSWVSPSSRNPLEPADQTGAPDSADDNALRRAAVARLRNMQSVPALLDALGDADIDIRDKAIAGLTAIDDPNVIVALVPLLGSWDEEGEEAVRSGAAEALRRLGEEQLVAAFQQALDGQTASLIVSAESTNWRDPIIDGLIRAIARPRLKVSNEVPPNSFRKTDITWQGCVVFNSHSDTESEAVTGPRETGLPWRLRSQEQIVEHAARALIELGAHAALPLLRLVANSMEFTDISLKNELRVAIMRLEANSVLPRPADATAHDTQTLPRAAEASTPASDTLPRATDEGGS